MSRRGRSLPANASSCDPHRASITRRCGQVDACAGENIMTLHGESLQNISNNVGQLFLQYAIRPYWTVCFAAPSLMANVTSDPLSPVTQAREAKFAKSPMLGQISQIMTRTARQRILSAAQWPPLLYWVSKKREKRDIFHLCRRDRT
jgi:hypothetical protein